MSVYKDGNTWSCSISYEDYAGVKKRHHKRGFKTKKEALIYKAEFLTMKQGSMDMIFASFVDLYFRDKSMELKERSIISKRHMINKHILPVFSEKPMNKIKASEIIQWQNNFLAKGYSESYNRMVNNQLVAIFNHAYRVYGLRDNPCSKVRKIGKSNASKMEFLTKNDYEAFICTVDQCTWYYTLYELLFWTGIRIGEALALTRKDIDIKNLRINIDKTYHRSNGRDIITSPKTENSVRVIDVPRFLVEEIEKYMQSMYDLNDNDRLYPITERAVQKHMKRHLQKARLKEVRVHDLRHSHVAYLIDQGVEPLLIKERLGHSNIQITMNTYGHLYPNRQREVADLLNKSRLGA